MVILLMDLLMSLPTGICSLPYIKLLCCHGKMNLFLQAIWFFCWSPYFLWCWLCWSFPHPLGVQCGIQADKYCWWSMHRQFINAEKWNFRSSQEMFWNPSGDDWNWQTCTSAWAKRIWQICNEVCHSEADSDTRSSHSGRCWRSKEASGGNLFDLWLSPFYLHLSSLVIYFCY